MVFRHPVQGVAPGRALHPGPAAAIAVRRRGKPDTAKHRTAHAHGLSFEGGGEGGGGGGEGELTSRTAIPPGILQGCGNGKNIPACNQVGLGLGCDISIELIKIVRGILDLGLLATVFQRGFARREPR